MDSKSTKSEFDGKIKTFWRERSTKAWSFFCPLCKAQRKIAYRPKPGGPVHFIQVGLTSAVFTLAAWQWFSWKGIVSFFPLWTAFELIYRTKVRAVLSCPHCGFDPYLYLVDVNQARREIESHWRKKFAEKGIPYPGEEPVTQPQAAAQSALTDVQPER